MPRARSRRCVACAALHVVCVCAAFCRRSPRRLEWRWCLVSSCLEATAAASSALEIQLQALHRLWICANNSKLAKQPAWKKEGERAASGRFYAHVRFCAEFTRKDMQSGPAAGHARKAQASIQQTHHAHACACMCMHVCPCMHGQTSMLMPMLMRMCVHAWSNEHATNASCPCSCNQNTRAPREKTHKQVRTCHAHACMQTDTYKNASAILFLAHPRKKNCTKLWTALILICVKNVYTANSKPVFHADFLLMGGLLEPKKQNLVLLASLMWFPEMVQ